MAKLKYHTEEERKEAKRRNRQRYNERHKHTPEYKAKAKEYTMRSRAKRKQELGEEEFNRRERERKRLLRLKNKEKYMVYDAKKRAKQKGWDFNIDESDITIPDICPVLGIDIDKSNSQWSPNSPSLDRIDNSKGYVKGNVMVISDRANRLKNDGTLEEFQKICRYMGG